MPSKSQERMYVERFLEVYHYESILVRERECPDFVLRDATGELGLEVVQVFRDLGDAGSPTKAAESRRAKFLRQLARKYYEAGGLPVEVKATLNGLQETDMDDLVDRMRHGRPSEPWANSTVTFNKGSSLVLTALPSGAGKYMRWSCINDAVGWVGRIPLSRIQQTIETKAAKLAEYRQATSRVALLLVVDRTFKSGMLEFDARGEAPDPMGFDMVYLYSHPHRAVRLA